MDTEEGRGRPGPKRLRILDWIPQIEYCPECGRQIVWQKRISVIWPQVTKSRRFKRCCDCAAAKYARERRATA